MSGGKILKGFLVAGAIGLFFLSGLHLVANYDLFWHLETAEWILDEGRVPAEEFASYTAFTYGAANQRSPFEPPIVAPPKTDEQKRNIGVKPPQNHVKQYLERFPLSALAMVGTLQKENSTFALVEDSQGGVHTVQVGDYLGDHWGQIESIEDARVDITEIVGDGSGGWLRRPRTIELRGQ